MRKALTLILSLMVLASSLQLTLTLIKPAWAAAENKLQNGDFENFNHLYQDWRVETPQFVEFLFDGGGYGGSDNYVRFHTEDRNYIRQNFSATIGYAVPVANVSAFTAYVKAAGLGPKLWCRVGYNDSTTDDQETAIADTSAWQQIDLTTAWLNATLEIVYVQFEKSNSPGDYLYLDDVNLTADYESLNSAVFASSPELNGNFSLSETVSNMTDLITNGDFDLNFSDWTKGGNAYISVIADAGCGVLDRSVSMTAASANYIEQSFTPVIRSDDIIVLGFYSTTDQAAATAAITIYYNDSTSETDTTRSMSAPWSYNWINPFDDNKFVEKIRLSASTAATNLWFDCITLYTVMHTYNETTIYDTPETKTSNTFDYPVRITALNESIGTLNNFTNWLENGAELTTSVSFIKYYQIGTTFTMNYSSFSMLTNASISNLEGCGDWVFAEETYYNFTATYTHPTDSSLFDVVRLRFWTPTQHGNITNTFSYNGSEYSASYSPSIDLADRPTRLKNGAASFPTNTTLTVIWPVWFTTESLDVYLSDCVDIDLWANETGGSTTNWTQTAADYFHIYNLGGFQITQTLNGFEEPTDAYRIEGGDVFDLVSMNGTGIEVDYYYRHLQHIKLRPRIRALIGYPMFLIRYQVDYCIDPDDWVTGWAVSLNAESVTVGTEIRYNFTASWYYNGTHISSKDVSIHSFNTYGSTDNGTAAETILWVDLWFNKENASSVVAGRVNAYEYAMKDNADAWVKWLSTNWGPERDLNKESTFYHELTAANGSRIHAGRIKMVRVKCWLYASWVDGQEGPQQVTLNDYQIFDVTLGDTQKPFAGVQTPTFEETISPVMPMGGWTGALWSGLMRLGAIISENILWGGLNLLPTFIAAMDSIAAAFGFPNAFTNLLTWISSGWNWLTAGFGYLISLMVPLFELLTSFISKFITLVAMGATYFGLMFTGIWNLLDGGLTAGFSIWDNLGLVHWITLGLILYPIYLLWVWDVDGFDAMASQIRFVLDLFLMFVHGFITVAQFVLNVIGRFIESIPVVE